MRKYEDLLQKEAEKLAIAKHERMCNTPWEENEYSQFEIEDMLPIARYVLEARAESYTKGWEDRDEYTSVEDYYFKEDIGATGYLPTEKEGI